MSAPPHIARQARIPELDGLRGLAILMVVLFHYIEQQGAVASPAVSFIQRLVIMGWSGVDLFFVLSGFLIGGILLESKKSPVYFKTFYIRRFLRIIPIYYLWILFYLLLASLAGGFLRAHSNSGVLAKPDFKVYAYFLFLQNVLPISFAGLGGAWFGHLWSLAVEEQFYLVSPLAVKLLSPRVLKISLVSVIACTPLLRIFLLEHHASPAMVSVVMPCRADSLAVGMLAAFLWRRPEFRERLAAGGHFTYGVLAVLFAGMLGLWKWYPQTETVGMETIGFTWMAFFYVTVLILALAKPAGFVARCARIRWLRELGRVSYCVYIIHLAVNVVFHAVLRRAPASTTDWRGVFVTVFAAIATYLIAWASWTLFEGPLVRYGHKFKYEEESCSA
jgi:peptidoglycan/LPS O-acetylase OafA/YrhL